MAPICGIALRHHKILIMDVQSLFSDNLSTLQGFINTQADTITQQQATILSLKAQLDAATVKPPVVNPTSPISIGPADLLKLSNLSGKYFKLKPGTYPDKYTLTNLSNVTIDGDNGAVFTNPTSRVMELKGKLAGVALKNFAIQNAAANDYSIAIQDFTSKYDPSDPDSYVNGLTLTGIRLTNSGALLHMIAGIKPDGSHWGVLKGLNIQGCVIKDCPRINSVVEVQSAFGYDISGNLVDNVNTAVDNHNAIFMLRGSGKFYGNTISNHQGNAARFWGFSHGDNRELVESYNNLVFNSRRYGAFEVQANASVLGSSVFTPTDYNIHNNTFGNLDYSKDGYNYSALGLDLYPVGGGNVIWANNLGYNLYTTDPVWHPITDMINNQNGVAVSTGNVYQSIQAQAIDKNFKSLFAGIGKL
jgi:hypothetical protein